MSDEIHEALVSLVTKEIGDAPAGFTVIHAGHYSLSMNRGKAVDRLEEETNSDTIIHEIATLAKTTWRVGCEVVSRQLPGSCRLMTLVNDWQHLDGACGSKREQARKASAARNEYYRSTSHLPQLFQQMLAANGLGEESVFKATQDQWLFSESDLRAKLSRTVSDLLRDPAKTESSGLNRYFTGKGDPIIHADDDDGGKFCLVYCGNTNCAGEFLQLLVDLKARGIRRFVNLYPIQCRLPVNTGTTLAHKIFDLSEMKIVNIALPNHPWRLGDIRIDRHVDEREPVSWPGQG